ncbi:MAG TPA: hypothetical protein VFU46_05055, partial [Gemmatimonadales bacterium]|nr:hypothetical protein [Gemmatimonadales bacterium]
MTGASVAPRAGRYHPGLPATRWTAAGALALALACRGPAPAAPTRETPSGDRPAAQARPSLSPTSPSELSHGEAPVGTGGTEPRIEPDAPVR